MKLMLIDGNSIVNRAFYGIRMLNAPDGTPTNAVYGFLTILQRLLDEEKPDGLTVTFDLRAPTFRHLQFEGYKAQRKPMPEDLAVQMPILKETLDAMGVPRAECEGWEADDLLGTLARRPSSSRATRTPSSSSRRARACSTSRPGWARRRPSPTRRSASARNTALTPSA